MNPNQIASSPQPLCPLCQSPGEWRYQALPDRCYAAPGQWGIRHCPAPTCGLAWLDPQPTLADIGKAYAGYYTHNQPAPGAALVRDVVWGIWMSYLGARFGYRQGVGPAWRRIFAPLARLHPGGRDELDSAAMYLPAPKTPSKLIDVGCGSGVLLARMQALGWQVEGIDVDAAGVAAARNRGVSVRCGMLTDQAYPENHFDAVYSSHVIEHVHDPVGLLRECCRILKPGGRLIFITPNWESWGHKLFGSAWLNLDPPRHLVLFSARNFRAAAESVGLVVESLRSTARTGWVYGALSRQIQRTGRGEMVELGKLANLGYGMIYQLRQRLKLRRDVLAGDELLLEARKPA